MKKLISLIVLVVSLMANDFSLGKEISSFSLPDQFDKSHTVDHSVQTIVVSFEKATGADMNAFLNSKNPQYLQEHNAVFVANISAMPSLITKWFAMPKMRKYKHTILLINDEDDERFIHKEDKFTVYKLKDGIVKSIKFFESAKEVVSTL